MATRSKTRTGMTLAEFLRWPRIDDRPYLEYYDGRVESKMSPQRKHSAIQKNLTIALDQFAKPSGLGEAFPNLRCTFAGQSIVPDIVFQLNSNIPRDEQGELLNESLLPPDILIEIRSPDQSAKKTKDKLDHAIVNGCPLGWYIDPERRIIDVYRPGQIPERLATDGFLDGPPVLSGFRLPVSQIFGWLKTQVQPPRDPGADPQ